MTKQAYIGIKYYEDNRNQGVGLGIEAGYAYAKGKYLLIVLQQKRELSSTMAGIASKIIRYDTLDQLDLTSL